MPAACDEAPAPMSVPLTDLTSAVGADVSPVSSDESLSLPHAAATKVSASAPAKNRRLGEFMFNSWGMWERNGFTLMQHAEDGGCNESEATDPR